MGLWIISQQKKLLKNGALPNDAYRSYAGRKKLQVYYVLVGRGLYQKTRTNQLMEDLIKKIKNSFGRRNSYGNEKK